MPVYNPIVKRIKVLQLAQIMTNIELEEAKGIHKQCLEYQLSFIENDLQMLETSIKKD